jgi:cytochrome c biogenesis protein CcdA
VNSTRLLGALALAAGGSLLLSAPFIGRDLFSEVTGMQVGLLWIPCTVAIALGLLAINLGQREEKEFFQDKGGSRP